MTSLARSNGDSGALFTISGSVPTNATWAEDIYFSEAGAPTVLTGLSWKMTFRCAEGNTSSDFEVSTANGLMSIVTDPDSGVASILRITVPAGNLNSYSGEYIADLASKDVANVVTLWGHGTITFTTNPVSF